MEPETPTTADGPGPEANIHKDPEQEQASSADSLPSSEQKAGIHKLPRELTDMIWPHASVWPTDDWSMDEIGRRWLVPGSPLVIWCFPVPVGGYRLPYFTGYFKARKNEEEFGNAAVLYTLSPPPIAQVCRETRIYALDRFGLDEDTSESRHKLADKVCRWENEYMITVISAAMTTRFPGNHNYRVDMRDCLSSPKLNFRCDQLILDLAVLRKDHNPADP
ncbi:hypothetical protein V8F06_006915 [Rhypophila decipiens]